MEENKEESLCEAARNGDVVKLKSLIESGADVTYFDNAGQTPLMYAAIHGCDEAVRALLNAGAPWNALTPNNISAGDFAMDHGHQSAFDTLLNAGIQAELVLGTIARKDNEKGSHNYLEDRVSFSEDKVMDAESKAVMMAWEKPLMEAHAKAICSGGGGGGGHVLNIGFGMGLVDTAIQQYGPISHTIIEAHPEVYSRMLQTGWGEKDNVKILFGRWQDVLPQLESYDVRLGTLGGGANLVWDARQDRLLGLHLSRIFFDTYGEYYEDMREFHQHLPHILKPGGIYSFFNGLCGSNPFFHVVYCQLVSLELENLGYSTQLIPLPVKDCLGAEIWEGVKHKYWQLDTYYLPVCQSIDDSE